MAFEQFGHADVAAWSRAVAEFMARHEGLRSELLIGGHSQVSSRLDYDPDVRIRTEEHDLTGDTGAWRDRLEAIIGYACRPTSWPASWFGVIDRGGSSTFIAAFDRSLVDEVSLLTALRDLHALYLVHVRPSSGRAPLPEVGSFLDAAVEEQAAPFDPDSMEACYWHDFLERFDATVPRSGFETGLRPGQEATLATSEHLLVTPGQLSWLTASLGRRASAPTVMLAAAAMAHRRAGTASGLTTMLQVDTRRLPEWEQAMGWFDTVVPLEIEAAATLRETLPRADLAWMLAESMSWVSVARVLSAVPLPVRWPSGDLNTVAWHDLRARPGNDLVDLTSAVLLEQQATTDEVQLAFTRTRRGVFVRCRRPDTPEAHDSFERWLAELELIVGDGPETAASRPRIDSSCPQG
ncbi:hypothetical protein [Nocardioides piscis]|uniref:Condensation domain-containing protein n=1 Tax=Nocardioides piscis TaxID=2714938 RepID=A0A6G7YEB6_9ACTN|nr:hypothetical protein [Nocardioides piscis]QIK74981.1 hypothetical protein G7071_05585 [Nocardioides piscis]